MKRNLILLILTLLVGTQLGLAQKQQTSDFYFRQAEELYRNDGSPHKILELLDLQLEEFPQHVDALFLRSHTYVILGRYDLALQDIDKAIAYHKPKRSESLKSGLYLWRGMLYAIQFENETQALADLDMAYRLSVHARDRLTSNILIERAQIYYELGDYTRSDSDYHAILKEDITNQAAMVGLARNGIAKSEYDWALEWLDKCERYNADYDEIYHLRIQIYDKMGKVDLAIDNALIYFDKSDDPDISSIECICKKHLSYALARISERINNAQDAVPLRCLRTFIYEWGGEYEKAIAEYNQLEHEYGSWPRLYFYRGNCYSEIGDWERAVTDMTRFIEYGNESNYVAVVSRGEFYRVGGQYEEAIADFTRGIELEPTMAYAYYQRGWSYELQGDDNLALRDYNAGIDVDKSYPYIYLMRGELYLRHKEVEKAQSDFEEVVKLDTIPQSGSCRHYALHFLGHDDEAIDWMDAILASDSISSGNYYDKACLLARMNRPYEALNVLRDALKRGFRSFAHIEHDNDMNPIRFLPEFQSLINEYKAAFVTHSKADISEKDQVVEVSEIPMKRLYGNVYEIPCTINDLPLKFILDTGTSSVSISSVEVAFMLKNGYLKDEDILGKEYFSTATGEIHEGTIIRLREIQIGDAVLRNINASVVHNQQAPLLLGQSVLERFGIITIDNINSKLIIKNK